MDRNLQLLGIAKKAGLLAVGGDDVSAAARNGKARLIISANDTSDGALRRARMNAQTGGAVHIVAPYSKFEIGNITQRGSPGTLAITDAGLAAKFVSDLARTDHEKYSDAAEQLTEIARIFSERKNKTPSGKRRSTQ